MYITLYYGCDNGAVRYIMTIHLHCAVEAAGRLDAVSESYSR